MFSYVVLSFHCQEPAPRVWGLDSATMWGLLPCLSTFFYPSGLDLVSSISPGLICDFYFML